MPVVHSLGIINIHQHTEKWIST